jgi:uncharacterized protein YjbI with pentapeptide repeats
MKRVRSWSQLIKRHPVATATVLIALFAAFWGLVAFGGYEFNWEWTGFNHPYRTLWDWLNLLGVIATPAVVAFGVAWFTTRQTQASEARNKQQHETEFQIATDNQRAVTLQAYIDKISELLLKENLGKPTADGELNPEYEKVRNIARVRTITVLTQLDARRVGYVFAFLREAGLMSATSDDNVVSLRDADLHTVNWSHAELNGVNLSGANLRQANLRQVNFSRNPFDSDDPSSEADLSKADLTEADLSGATLNKVDLSGATLNKANLSHAHFWYANLSDAVLGRANLSGALLREANLRIAVLSGANLSGASLRHADLSEALLIEADLSEANLIGADLSHAYLGGAVVTAEQLKAAKSLTGATMPDGSIHP